MKKIILILSALALLFLTSSNNITKTDLKKNYTSDNDKIKNCVYKGFKLYGKVKVVSSFPDIKVQIVENFPDLKVKVVQNFPDDCGKWEFVESFPDIKVQFVESFPDIKVKFVENFPGEN